MVPAFLLALREGIEIALIIGIVLGALQKTKRSEYRSSVWSGAGIAALLAASVAGVLTRIGVELEGRAEQLFEGAMLLLAAGVLTWMIFWMQRQSRYLKGNIEADVRRATGAGGAGALFSLAFLAVFREGLELALFLTATALTSAPLATLAGAALGLAGAALIGYAIFAASVRLNLKTFFSVTSVLLLLFAAGLVAHGVHEFNEAGVIPSVVEHLWDTNHLIAEDSGLGVALGTLFGYNGNPSLSEFLSYVFYLAVIGFAVWRSSVTQTVYQPAR